MKAFLSHSSFDKEFVRAVADNLKRQYCVYDERAFGTGIDFKKSIEEGLDDSSVFVLFASAASLASLWVNFEVEEAWYRRLETKMRDSLVFITDSSVEISTLPNWLRRAKAVKFNAPKTVAREIREHLDDLLRHQQSPVFVGRRDEFERLQQTLTPPDGSTPPNAVIIKGLPGIGRRTLIQRAGSSLLGLKRLVVIRVQVGDEIADLAIKTADEIEPYSTKDGLSKIVAEIEGDSDINNLNRILRNFEVCTANGELPVLLDEGGLLDEDGRFSEGVRRIIATLPTSVDTYLFFICSRRPVQPASEALPFVAIPPLKPDDIKSLLGALSRRRKVEMTPAEISELSESIEGFPPACSYTVELASEYGVATVLANKFRLVDFRRTLFVKYLTESKLEPVESQILRTLAEYSPLPISVLGEATKLDAISLADKLMKLIDFSLVTPGRYGLYYIADPVRDAALKLGRVIMTQDEHRAVAENLKSYLASGELEKHSIDLYRVLFRAATSCNDRELASQAVHLANDVIQLMERNYHTRDYDSAIRLGHEAVALRPKNISIRSFLIRALIQEARWNEAEEALKQFEILAPARDAMFLRGFLKRKMGRIKEAIHFFRLSENAGRRDMGLQRELAWCYSIIGNLDEANKYLNQILAKHTDNPFVIDISVQIATKLKDEALARKRLQNLKEIEKASFYQHRLSHVEASFGNILAARDAALLATKLESKPTFEMIAQLATCELKLGNLDEADALSQQLDQIFNKRPEFRICLKAWIQIEKKHYGGALLVLLQHPDKSDLYYKQLRFQALNGELAESALPDAKREQYKRELAILENTAKAGTLDDLNQLLDA